jgi:molybdate transport system substrate-binding protein
MRVYAQPHELHVAAAADLQTVMPSLAAEYEKASGVHLVVSYGSSATLTEQILHGSPADVFLAADLGFPQKVVAAGLADTPEPLAYAQGTLVLWARKDSPAQPLRVERLSEPGLKTVAIANSEHAPYGRAAVAALTQMRLLARIKPHLVTAENVAQAAQFAESGNAEMGLISMTQASSPHFRQVGSYVVMPRVYPPIVQGAVVMRGSSERTAAHAFLDWLRSPAVQGSLPSLGLEPFARR